MASRKRGCALYRGSLQLSRLLIPRQLNSLLVCVNDSNPKCDLADLVFFSLKNDDAAAVRNAVVRAVALARSLTVVGISGNARVPRHVRNRRLDGQFVESRDGPTRAGVARVLAGELVVRFVVGDPIAVVQLVEVGQHRHRPVIVAGLFRNLYRRLNLGVFLLHPTENQFQYSRVHNGDSGDLTRGSESV